MVLGRDRLRRTTAKSPPQVCSQDAPRVRRRAADVDHGGNGGIRACDPGGGRAGVGGYVCHGRAGGGVRAFHGEPAPVLRGHYRSLRAGPRILACSDG